MPAAPPPVVAPRRKSRQIVLRHDKHPVAVGGDAPVSVQSMATTVTADINATLQQIAELTASGCQVVRVAVPSQDDADALPIIAKKSGIPVVADIHFQPKYVFAALDAGCAGVRVNPGNIKQFDDKVGEIARAAADCGTPIRIGVNAGSLDKRLMEKYGKATPEALVESALWEASLFEEHDFRDIKISVKHHDPVIMMQAYMQLAEQCDYPLHLGVTEAGPTFRNHQIPRGCLRCQVALSLRRRRRHPRVSLSAPPIEEVRVKLADFGIAEPARAKPLEIVSFPSCAHRQEGGHASTRAQYAKVLIGLALALSLAACDATFDNHGYVPPAEALEQVQIGASRDAVIAAIGTPGAAGVMRDEAWLYTAYRIRSLGVRAPQIMERQLLAISFDANGRVSNVEEFGLEDGRVVRACSRRLHSLGDFGQELTNRAFQFFDHLAVAWHPLDPYRQMLRHPWIKADKIAPDAAGASHLPLHLRDILAVDLPGKDGVDMRGRVGALDFEQAI